MTLTIIALYAGLSLICGIIMCVLIVRSDP